jgi:hypothetical protein
VEVDNTIHKWRNHTPFVAHLQKEKMFALICIEAYRTTKKVKTLICIWNLLSGGSEKDLDDEDVGYHQPILYQGWGQRHYWDAGNGTGTTLMSGGAAENLGEGKDYMRFQVLATQYPHVVRN